MKKRLSSILIGTAGLAVVLSLCSLPLLGQSSELSSPTPSLVGKKPELQKNDDKPFWRRPELQRKMNEERAILVSVKRENRPNDLIRFTMNGAGLVDRSKDFCFQTAQKFERLKEVSDHFKTVTFDSNSRQLFVVTEALGYQARMILKVLPVSEDWRSELQWEVIWGHFKGMTGLIGFEQTKDNRTEVSLNARYEAKELPLPRILMGFALEVITQKVAERMRAFIESTPAQASESRSASVSHKNKDPLASIRLPEGFSISIFADDVPGARQMALSPGGALYVGTRNGSVYAIDNATQAIEKGERAKAARTLAKDLNEPNGVAFHNGSLYVAEISRILRFDNIEKADSSSTAKPVVLRSDYPQDTHHGWKYIAVGPDGWLYIPVGAPCNVCKRDNKIYASITRMSLDGKKREIFSEGVRNTVGFDWHPKTRALWFTDNGRDMMGDEIPGDELNTAPKSGLHFGFPYCHQGDLKDPGFGAKANCDKKGPYTYPVQVLGPHVAALGMKFYTQQQFPEKYRNQIFIAEHGSWNRSKKIGYRITTVKLDEKGNSLGYDVFAEGWLQNEKAWGRPVDIVVAPDGSLLVSDDKAGAIYRISYKLAH